jgi:predicted transcriptional regulator
MASTLDKSVAKALIDNLPDGATWDDLMHEIYVRQRIERGMEDSRAGRGVTTDEVRKRLGLND